MDREVFLFEELKPKLLANNDPQSADGVQLALSTYLTNIYLNFENNSNNQIDTNDNTPDDLIFILDQLDSIINHYIESFGKNKSNDSPSSEIYHLSHNVITLLGKVYSHILSIMLKQAHEKFNIRLIDITNKMTDIFMSDIKKLSMSKNWYSTLKHLSIIILQFIFTKLNGFLNSYKNPLLTVSYKHLKKCYDNYNSAIDNSTFKSNYFTDILKLIDIILANDTSNKALDDKLFKRLMKLTKQINSKNSNGLYTYSLLSVVHTNNFLVSLLKSDKYISSITTKKSSLNPYHFLNQTNSYTQILISSMDTNNKKFRLSVSKNLADLLVFNYIVYGVNLNQPDNCLEYILDFLLNEYSKKSNNYKIKTGVIEVIIQFFSKTNLYYQTNTIQNNGNNDGTNNNNNNHNNNNNSSFSNTGDVLNGSNFMSLTFFATLNKIYFKIFNVGNLKNSANSKKTSSLKKLKEPHDLLTINDSTTFNEAITTLNQLEQLYKFLINEVGSDINKLIILGRLVITNNNENNNSTSNNLDPNSRLLSLGDIFTKPDTIPDNHWYVLSLLKLIEMLICDLDQYVASQQDGLSITGNSGSVSKNDGTTGDDANNDNDENNVKPVQVSQDLATQISHILFTLCKHRNFRVRVSSVITLVKLLKIKPDLSFYILNEALNKILFSLENSSGKGNENSFIFNENHGLAFLISSILTSVPKEYINNDFLLRVFTTTTNFLKKFNSSVLTTNLFSNTGTYISNNSYEKQLISWIMLMGLFNYATDSSGSSNHNYFLSEGSQFLNVWKNLLTHSLPSAFVQFDKSIETGIVSISNLNELMKLVEIKNHSLVCLLSYITYLASTKSSAIVHTHDDSNKSNSSLLTPEIAKELIAIVNKSYLFINGLKSQITNVIKLPGVLDHSIRLNKLRIYQTYIKLLPFVNIKTEINSTMLVEIVNDFSDINSFRYEPKNDLFSRKSSSNSSSTSSSSKQQTNSYVIDEYDLYFVNDGLSYGLTSKINMFKVDELLVKCMGIDSNQLDNYSHINEPENSFHLNNGLRIESNNLKSTAQPLTVFDSPLETSIYNSIQHSILNDYLMILFNGCDTIGYTDTQNYPVNNDTMSVDICIELFAIIFPYVTVKIQQSIIETLRSAIFFNSNESNTLNNHNTANGKNSSNNKDSKDSTNTGVPLSLTLRKKAITVNCSVALHSLLSFMNNHNANNSKHLTLDFSVSNMIFQTLKNMGIKDDFIANLNSQSIGLCTSLIDSDHKEEFLSGQLNLLINSIVENTDPFSRSFNLESLASISQYSNLGNLSSILNVVFTLILDPHPRVHISSVDSLSTIISSQYQMELGSSLISKILQTLSKIWLRDDFGINSSITLAININYDHNKNSTVTLARLVRLIINNLGPSISTLEDSNKEILRNLLFGLMNTVSNDFEVIAKELLMSFEELVVFDKTLFSYEMYIKFIKFIMINNFKVGVYSNSLSNLPIDEADIESINPSPEFFPTTTSHKNWLLAVDSFYQLTRIHRDGCGIITKETEDLLWMSLEFDSDNRSLRTLFQTWLENSMSVITTDNEQERFGWFEKLISHFNMPKHKLYDSLFRLYKTRINSSGMFFNNIDISSTSKVTDFSAVKASAADDDDDDDIENPDVLGEDDIALTTDAGDNNQDSSNRNTKEVAKKSNKNFSNQDEFDNSLPVMVMENEPVSWKFKLFILDLLIQYLLNAKRDSRLFAFLSTKISEFVRIGFICSASNLIRLRISALKLLGLIIDLYGRLKDPLYPEASILDQQQAQIITAIVPAFSRDSNLKLASEAIIIASKLVCSNITQISKLNRVVKILTAALEEFSLANTNSSSIEHGEGGSQKKKILKIGEIQVLTIKSQNQIKIAVLQAWARMKIQGDPADKELQELLSKYINILIPLWLYSLRDFAMLKYGGDFIVPTGEDVDLATYENCWLDFFQVIGILVEEDPSLLSNLLGEEYGEFIIILFGQSMESLIKTSSKNGLKIKEDEILVLVTLNRLLRLDVSTKVIFNDNIFVEFIDLMDRLVLISNPSLKIPLIELCQTIFENYFKSKNAVTTNDPTVAESGDKLVTSNKNSKTEEEIHADVDKLFELLRINMLAIIQLLPFIKDGEINVDKLKLLHKQDLNLIKKCYDSILDMINYLPDVIQIDLYACLLYTFTLIYELNNEEIILILLPSFKKTISGITYLTGGSDLETNNNPSILLNNFYQSIQQILVNNEDSKSSILTTYIISTTCEDKLILDINEGEFISNCILNGFVKEKTLITISTQTIKTIIKHFGNSNQSTSGLILKNFIPKLIKIFINTVNKMANLTSDDDETITAETVDDPRLIIEILVIFIKSIQDEENIIKSYKTILPILTWFIESVKIIFKMDLNYLNYLQYVHNKLLELVNFNPNGFKSAIQDDSCFNDSERKNIETIVKFDINALSEGQNGVALSNGNGNANGEHIQLKTFG